jgi:phenylpyruvate tautomerase PptA (4-oxalocrotonate tautomerase family)
MPTYAFTTTKRLSPEQRSKLVESVTTIHQVEASAPRYFVQVVFYTVEPGSNFIGGEVAPDDHVWVRADIRAGRTREQKAAILHRIMQETGEIFGISTESVWVYTQTFRPKGLRSSATCCRSPAARRRGSRRCLAHCARS